MAAGELAIVIAGRRGGLARRPSYPAAARVHPGAERHTLVRGMPEKPPADRGRRLVDALIVWITPDCPLQLGINRFEVRVSAAGDTWIEPSVVKMDFPAPTHPMPPAGDRPPRRRGLHQPEHPPGVLGRSAPPRRLARRPGARGRAARFRARLAGEQSPAGESTARVLAGYRRTAVGRGRGQARPFVAADLAAVLATCHRPRRRGHGLESDEVAQKRGRLDAVIAGLLFMAGMRRSEVSALRWGDVAEAESGDGVLVAVRRGKTNPEGESRDVRFVKGGVAVALRTLRDASSAGPGDRVVPLSPQMVGLRFQASARAAGVEPVTAHSGRVGLASELTRRGASTTDVMLAGNWKTSRMVAHYSSGATAERGAVAQYL